MECDEEVRRNFILIEWKKKAHLRLEHVLILDFSYIWILQYHFFEVYVMFAKFLFFSPE